MRVAIIDLGTNSLRFDVYDLFDDHEFSLVHREKFMIRLGDEVFKTGEISDFVMARALETFEQIKIYIKEMKVKKTFAFATSALRTADNSDDFIKKIKKKIGIKIQIISGKEEAEKIALGILENERIPSSKALLVDIGGGSTEVSYIKKEDIKWSYSLPVGSLRLNQLFFENFFEAGPKKREKMVAAAKAHVQQVIITATQNYDDKQVDCIIGSSGTIKSISRLIRKQFGQTPPLDYHQVELLLARLCSLSFGELKDLRGLEPKRRDLIIPGLVLFLCVLDYYGGTSIYTTRYALRDGLLIDIMNEYLA